MPSKKKTKKRKLIIGNWKMNPATADEARRIYASVKKQAQKLENTDTVVCPPFIFASLFKANGAPFLGVQDIYFEERGSFTGEVSALMAASIGARYAIIGHSERRKMGETDEDVSRKVTAACNANIKAVVCIGESVRDSQGEYLGFLRNQIKNSLAKIQKKQLSKLVIAYEPVWAIGAQEAMTPRDLHEMSIFIKKILSDMFGQEEAMKVPILYGGAVTFRNARDIIVEGEVDGLLVGRESVNPPGFNEILKTIDAL